MSNLKIYIRRISIALAAITAVGLFMYYYFLILIPRNEAELNKRGFRILKRIEQNINEKREAVLFTIDEVYSRNIIDKNDTLRNKKENLLSKKTQGKNFFTGLRVQDLVTKSDWKEKYSKKQFYPEYDDYFNKWGISFFGDFYYDSDLQFINESNQEEVLKYNYDADKFFEHASGYRNDFFEEYCFLYKDSVLYQTENIVYHNTKDFYTTLDSGKASKPRLLTDSYEVKTLAGKQYYVFYHPLPKVSDMDLVICGMIPYETYRAAKYHIDTDILIKLLLYLTLLFFAVPFIKIGFMSVFERLQRWDVVYIGISTLIGCALSAVLFLFDLNEKAEKIIQSRNLHSFGDTLKSHLETEIVELKEELKKHEINLYNKDSYQKWMKVNSSDNRNELSTSLAPYFNNVNSKHYVEMLILLDSLGNNWAAWGEKADKTPDLNLDGRKYVQAFIDPYTTLKTSSDAAGTSFYFDPIFSHQSQENTFVISKTLDTLTLDSLAKKKPEKDIKILALETRLFSLMHTATPSETGFCLLDKEGEVLFHSDDRRNLRENFLEESNNNALLCAALSQSSDTSGIINLYGKKYLAHVSPLPSLGYNLVTFYDYTPYLDRLSNQMLYTFLLLVALIAVVSCIFILFLLFTSRSSLLKQQYINLNWLVFNTVNPKGYWHLFLLVIPLTLFFGTVTFTHSVQGFNLLVLSFGMPVLLLFLTSCVIYLSYREEYVKQNRRDTVIRTYRVFWMITLKIIFFLILLKFYLQFKGSIWIYVAAFVGTNVLFYKLFISKRQNYSNLNRRINNGLDHLPKHPTQGSFLSWMWPAPLSKEKKQMTLVVVTIMLLVANICIFPVFNFYNEALRLERELLGKRNALEISEGIQERETWLRTQLGDYTQKGKDLTNLLLKGVYRTKSTSFNKDKVFQRLTPNEDARYYLGVSTWLSNKCNIYEAKKLFMHKNSSDDGSWFWQDNSFYSFPINASSNYVKNIKVVLPTSERAWTVLNQEDVVYYILIALIFLFSVYTLLINVYKKLTLFDYFNECDRCMEEKIDVEYFEKYFKSELSTNLLVIALPGTRIQEKIGDALLGMNYTLVSNVIELTKIDIFNSLYTKNETSGCNENQPRVVVLPYFDLKTTSLEYHRTRIKELAKLFYDASIKVVWISSSDPFDQIAELQRRTLEAQKQQSSSHEVLKDFAMLEREQDKILQIIDDFYKINYPLEDQEEVKCPEGPIAVSEETTGVNEVGSKETNKNVPSKTSHPEYRFGHYLQKLSTLSILNNEPKGYCNEIGKVDLVEKEEKFILKIQDTAKNYYYSIWSCLSSKEKYVLYDLAMDDLTNYKNFPILIDLRRKGVLYFDNRDKTLKIFNRSFRNFILTVVDPQEAEVLEKR